MHALLALAALVGAMSEAPQARPNVLVILADDLGVGDVGAFGGDLPTPSIDRLASEGARLTRCYVAAPVCTPSRFALLTGRYPRRAQGGLERVGMRLDPRHDDHGLRPGETTLAEVLQTRGYATSLVGKWHLGHGAPEHFPTRHGFDAFYGVAGGCVDYYTHAYGPVPDWFRGEEPVVEEGYATRLLTDEAVRQLSARDDAQPFFLLLSYTAPHYGKSVEGGAFPEGSTRFTRDAGEHTVGDVTYRLHNSLQAPPETIARFAHIEDPERRLYAAMVAELDRGVGRVLDALDEAGLADDTLVLFLADHGADETASSAGSNRPLRGAKHSTWEGGLRVPALLRWPGHVAPGTVLEQVSSTLDLYPTLAGLAGATVARESLDGLDLGAAWFGGEQVQRDLFWFGRPPVVVRWPWKLRGDALYDLVDDVAEQHDVAAEHAGLVDVLRASYAAAAD